MNDPPPPPVTANPRRAGRWLRCARQCAHGAGFWLKRAAGSKTPFIAGLVLNESCNLRCEGCRVARADRSEDAGREEVAEALRSFRRSGIRNLAVTGGEPFHWRSDGWRVRDVVAEARRLGFLAVTVYTNGTLPFDDCGADTVFVSPHGLEGLEGGGGAAWEACRRNLDATRHGNVVLNYTVNSRNCGRLREVCAFARGHRAVRGVFFYFHTPYYGRDELFQPMEEKRRLAAEILSLKREGFPVFNSAAALRAFARDGWKRPSDLCVVWEKGRLFRCCRSVGNDDACRECGYLGYPELERILALRPSAVLAGTRYLG